MEFAQHRQPLGQLPQGGPALDIERECGVLEHRRHPVRQLGGFVIHVGTHCA